MMCVFFRICESHLLDLHQTLAFKELRAGIENLDGEGCQDHCAKIAVLKNDHTETRNR